MKFKVLRQKYDFQEFIWIENNDRYTSQTPQLLNSGTTLEKFIEYQKSIGYTDIDLSDCELVDYVLIEKQQIYIKLLMLLRPLLNLLSLSKLKDKINKNTDDDIYEIIINSEIENCELIFPQLKTIFDE